MINISGQASLTNHMSHWMFTKNKGTLSLDNNFLTFIPANGTEQKKIAIKDIEHVTVATPMVVRTKDKKYYFNLTSVKQYLLALFYMKIPNVGGADLVKAEEKARLTTWSESFQALGIDTKNLLTKDRWYGRSGFGS